MLRVLALSTLVWALAGTAFGVGDEKEVKLNGFIIDNMCAAAAGADDLAATAEKHPTACATMPNCVKSGYAVVAEGKQYKLDEAGNKKVMPLLKTAGSRKGLAVTVEGTYDGETLRVKSIKLAAPDASSRNNRF
jgi:hypothetical protein